MNVQPELTSHPKFLLLEKRVGDGAAKFLLKLWGHCQQNQRGEFWSGADADYVEVVCGWAGEPGKLCAALSERVRNRPGWIEADTNGVRVHHWNETNAGLLHNWRVGGSGGRPRKNPRGKRGSASANPRVNTPEPKGQPINEGDEGDEGEGASRPAGSIGEVLEEKNAARDAAHIPSVEEVIVYGKSRLANEIPEGYCRKYHNSKEIRPGSWVYRGELIDWQRELRGRWDEDRPDWVKKNAAARRAQGGSVEELMAQLEKETDTARRNELRDQIRQMEAAR